MSTAHRYGRPAVALISLLLAPVAIRGQGDVRIGCLPSKTVVGPGEAVRVNAWVGSASGAVVQDVTARWSTTAGRIEAQTAATRWLLEDAPIDRRHTATVDVSVAGTPAGSCSIGVWVANDPGDVRLRGEYVTRRAFLRREQVGEAGFGLYSYFLMREPTTAADQERAASFVAAFLDVLVGVADQENYVERRRLNGSYLPVTLDPPTGLANADRAAWALAHYDYEHSKLLLSLYPTLTGRGPFIIAVTAPLRSPVKPMLPWDFGQLDRSTIPEGVSRFMNQAAQLYDWQNQSALQKLRDQLLTTLAGMFVGRAKAEDWLQIVR
jgi:hypothetical protein